MGVYEQLATLNPENIPRNAKSIVILDITSTFFAG
jgi:hypothetical protein